MGGRLDGVGEAAGEVGLHDQPVDDDLDVVLLVFVERDLLRQIVQAAVDAGADKPRPLGVLEHLDMLALLAVDHRGQNLKFGALRQLHHPVDDLVDGLLADLLAALGAVGHAHPGPQQAQIVVDLRDCAHGGTGVFGGGLLVDGDGRGQALDVVEIRLVHLAQKLPGIGGQRLHIPPLALGIDGVEGKARLAGAGQAGKDHQLVPGDLQIHILEVVLPCPFD